MSDHIVTRAAEVLMIQDQDRATAQILSDALSALVAAGIIRDLPSRDEIAKVIYDVAVDHPVWGTVEDHQSDEATFADLVSDSADAVMALLWGESDG